MVKREAKARRRGRRRICVVKSMVAVQREEKKAERIFDCFLDLKTIRSEKEEDCS